MDLSRDELIAKHPHLKPSDGKLNPLTLGAKNLRAELKRAGISALVRTERFSGGDALNVAVADPALVNQANTIAAKYRDQAWNSRQEDYEYIHSTWHATFGSAKHVNAQEAWGDDLEKLQGTYKAPPKKELTLQEVQHKFLIAATRGTASVVAKHLPRIMEESDPSYIKQGWSNSYHAIQKGRHGAFDALAAGGADPNLKLATRSGETPLHVAVAHEKIEQVRELIENGADVNAVYRMGITSLHLTRNADIAMALIEGGADYDALDYKGRTADDEVKRGDDKGAIEVIQAARRRAQLTEQAQRTRIEAFGTDDSLLEAAKERRSSAEQAMSGEAMEGASRSTLAGEQRRKYGRSM